MSTCQPLQWLPDSLADDVRLATSLLLDQWAADWGAPAASAVDAQRLAGSLSSTTAEPPWGLLPESWHAALARALLGPAGGASAIGRRAVQEATTDLQASLRRRFQTAPGERAWQPSPLGHAGVAVNFELLGHRFVMALDPEELRAGGWLKLPPSAALPKVALEQALASVAVPLTAQLGSAAVSAAEVLQLQPGDVLLLEQTLDAPLQVVCAGSPLRLHAHLGTTPATKGSAQRAMRWLAQ